MPRESQLTVSLREGADQDLADQPEQLPLLPLGPGDVEVVEADGQVRRRGRPPGSMNRRNADLARFIEGTFGNPLTVLASVYARPLAELVRDLRCKPIEALRVQMDAAEKVAPYVASKMPVKVDVDNRAALTLIISQEAAGETIEGDTVEIVENQEVSASPTEGVGS